MQRRYANDIQNKSLSDAFDPVLALQGIGWLTRKAIGAATVTQTMRQSSVTGENGESVTQIALEQTATGGLKGSTETRVTDWYPRGHSDWLFGTVEGKSRYNTLAKIQEENKGQGVLEEDAKYLAEGWLQESAEGDIFESFVDNAGNKWTAWQVWGFAEIGGERKQTRRLVIRKKDKDQVQRVRLVYDYAGPVA